MLSKSDRVTASFASISSFRSNPVRAVLSLCVRATANQRLLLGSHPRLRSSTYALEGIHTYTHTLTHLLSVHCYLPALLGSSALTGNPLATCSTWTFYSVPIDARFAREVMSMAATPVDVATSKLLGRRQAK